MTHKHSNENKIKSWKYRIKKAGFRQYELAKMVNLSQAHLSGVIIGVRDPKASLVDKVEEILIANGQRFK